MDRFFGLVAAIGTECYVIARELSSVLDIVMFERRKTDRQLVITFTLPRFDHVWTLLLITIGVIGIGYSIEPMAAAMNMTSAVTHESARASHPPSMPVQTAGLSRSVPLSVQIPSVGIDTSLIELGKNPDGTLATPERYDVAGWYTFAPTPGEIGPAIIVGHVDNYLGPAVFFRLREVRLGALITVQRADGVTARFRVERVALFDQQNFPTNDVYGNTNQSALRLITCGGVFNALTGHYTHNTVVYATYIR